MAGNKLTVSATTLEIEAVATKTGWYARIGALLGFKKKYNLTLFIIFGGAMLGFVIAKFQYLNIDGIFSKQAAVGEWYWYRGGHYRVGITLHLACSLPTGFLMILQFVPAIRHNCLILHRINGYIIMTLVFFSNIGVLMIVRRSFGGDVSIQSAVGLLVVLTTVSITMAYINVKKFQIDQHRAWMLRAMFYLAVIVTERILLILSALVTTLIGSYYTVWSCGELLYLAQQESNSSMAYMKQNYPGCFNGTESPMLPHNHVAVNANLASNQLEKVSAALRMNFGQTVWLALVIHLVGVELYLSLTPRESQRLRRIAYEKQLEAGMSNPGSAGLVVERYGDADEWKHGNNATEMALLNDH